MRDRLVIGSTLERRDTYVNSYVRGSRFLKFRNISITNLFWTGNADTDVAVKFSRDFQLIRGYGKDTMSEPRVCSPLLSAALTWKLTQNAPNGDVLNNSCQTP